MSDSVSPPLERDPADGTYHVSREWTASQSTTVAIVTVIDAIPALEFAETETVRDRVDPDALDALFEPPLPARARPVVAFGSPSGTSPSPSTATANSSFGRRRSNRRSSDALSPRTPTLGARDCVRRRGRAG